MKRRKAKKRGRGEREERKKVSCVLPRSPKGNVSRNHSTVIKPGQPSPWGTFRFHQFWGQLHLVVKDIKTEKKWKDAMVMNTVAIIQCYFGTGLCTSHGKKIGVKHINYINEALPEKKNCKIYFFQILSLTIIIKLTCFSSYLQMRTFISEVSLF